VWRVSWGVGRVRKVCVTLAEYVSLPPFSFRLAHSGTSSSFRVAPQPMPDADVVPTFASARCPGSGRRAQLPDASLFHDVIRLRRPFCHVIMCSMRCACQPMRDAKRQVLTPCWRRFIYARVSARLCRYAAALVYDMPGSAASAAPLRGRRA